MGERGSSIRLDARDLRVLHVSAAWMADMLPALVDGVARELYAHPDARPYYSTLEQVRGQSMAWIGGVLAAPDLDALEALLVRVARIHRRIGINTAFFIEICAMVGEHVSAAAEAMPVSPEVRAGVIRTFTRLLFRQAALFCAEPEP